MLKLTIINTQIKLYDVTKKENGQDQENYQLLIITYEATNNKYPNKNISMYTHLGWKTKSQISVQIIRNYQEITNRITRDPSEGNRFTTLYT